MPETRGKNRVLRSGDTMTGQLILSGTNIACNTYKSENGTEMLKFNTTGMTTYVCINSSQVLFPKQAPTASAPAYVKGGLYFDTTLNKLMVGGAAGWETVTSV